MSAAVIEIGPTLAGILSLLITGLLSLLGVTTTKALRATRESVRASRHAAAQLSPNGGGSALDKINTMAEQVAKLAAQGDELRRRLDSIEARSRLRRSGDPPLWPGAPDHSTLPPPPPPTDRP